ncbi:MAG: hypothetical protein IKJ35_08280 [Clostridia bacterium]|nr:hypothetical protein [Clostridia bacterium]
MDVIIFSGQSNMQGQSERLSENDVVNDAYEYKWLTDELLPLQNPVGKILPILWIGAMMLRLKPSK